jgi:hypothetical protein
MQEISPFKQYKEMLNIYMGSMVLVLGILPYWYVYHTRKFNFILNSIFFIVCYNAFVILLDDKLITASNMRSTSGTKKRKKKRHSREKPSISLDDKKYENN